MPTLATMYSSLRNPLRNSSISSARRQAGEAGEQRSLDRLEQEQRDAGEQDALAERGDQLVLAGLGEDVGGHRTGVDQRGGEHRADQQPAEVRGDLLPAGRRARVGVQLAAPGDVGDAEQR
ncbi:MAG: hypothetical protein QM733_09820 [Ilumatobacteraceae bacterium]